LFRAPWRKSMYKLAIGVLAAAPTIAACGGSSKSSTSGGGTTTTGPGGSTAAPSGGGEGGNGNDLSKTKIKITYTDTTTDTSGAGAPSTSTFTLALDGKGKSAFTNSDSSDPSATSTIYSDGTSTVSCTGSGATAKCTQLPSAQAGAATSLTQTFSVLSNLSSALGGGDKSSENIAGRDASCVKYKAKDVIGRLSALPLFKDSSENPSDYDDNDTASICVDKKSGWVLKLAATKKGVAQDGLLATAVGDPSDSDFTPPVTPVTLPSIPSVSIPNVSIPSNQGQ
jgi:hypothetical protein